MRAGRTNVCAHSSSRVQSARYKTGAVRRSAARVAAAAGLATAATSVGFTDNLHPSVAPILFHFALLPPAISSSSSLGLPGFAPSGLRCLGPSPALANSPPGAFGRLRPKLAASGDHSPSDAAAVHMASPSLGRWFTTFPAAGWPSLSPASRSAPPAGAPSLRAEPSFLGPTPGFPQAVLHRHVFHGLQPRLPTSSFAEFSHLPRFRAPFSAGDVSAQLASSFSSSSSSVPSSRLAVAASSCFKDLHTWHTPVAHELGPEDEAQIAGKKKPVLTVVLLGWLGSQQKHLKKYAEWYNARGIHAVTFTLPMRDVLSVSMGGKVEEHVEELTNQLATWVESSGEQEEVETNEDNRQLIFHIFSNTGWLTYGVVLEKLSSRGNEWVDKIKGCVVDSAPAADPDPSVWASGFSAALWKKRNGGGRLRDSGIADSRHKVTVHTPNSRVTESALHALLEKFFFFFLQIPFVHQRLSQVIAVLSKDQPPCPQLYIYSTADKVIPSKLVESFIETQRRQGRVVRSCNFLSSPHVDHFRSFPEIYGNQVSTFLQECLQKSPVELTTVALPRT